MRNLEVIGNKVIEIIEKNYTEANKEVLISILNDIINSYRYSAPEITPMRWQHFNQILNTYLSPIDTDWKEKIRKLMADEIKIEDIKEK